MAFTVPHFAVGQGDRFRISASEIAERGSAFSCPIGLALRARVRAGSVRFDPAPPRSRFDPASTLNFAIQRAACGVIDGTPPDRILDRERDLTHSQRRYLRHALDVLPDLLPAAGAAAGADYRRGEDIIGRVDRESLRGSVTVWAVHLATADGRVHEAVRLRLGALRSPTDRDLDWTAAAAVALATDEAVADQARLRVSEFSVLDGELSCGFDGSRRDAIALFADRGAPLWPALDGTVYRPGSGCADCPALRVCPAVPARPGLLGITERGIATRRLSASDLVSYRRCPTAFRTLRADHLPDRYAIDMDSGTGANARDRGLAVHAFIARAHSREPAQACTPGDLPDPGTAAAKVAASIAGLDPARYAMAHPFLLRHTTICPLDRQDFTGWEVERVVVCHDPDAAAVVVTTPDLAYRVADGTEVIWRETKTAGTIPVDATAALDRYPDVALDLVLLADRARSAGVMALVELEVLTAEDAEAFALSTGDAEAVDHARSLVAAVARAFVTDVEYARRPSASCPGCPAHGWCDPPDDPARSPTATSEGGDG